MYIGSRLFSKVAKYLTLSLASLAASVICALPTHVSLVCSHLTASHACPTLIQDLRLPLNAVLNSTHVVHQEYAKESKNLQTSTKNFEQCGTIKTSVDDMKYRQQTAILFI